MTIEQAAEAIRELQGIVGVQRREIDDLRARMEVLELAKEQHYRANQELSAHLNGMTYP